RRDSGIQQNNDSVDRGGVAGEDEAFAVVCVERITPRSVQVGRDSKTGTGMKERCLRESSLTAQSGDIGGHQRFSGIDVKQFATSWHPDREIASVGGNPDRDLV